MLVSTEKLKVSFNTFVVAFSEEGHGRIYGMSYIITADFSWKRYYHIDKIIHSLQTF